jgi:hypothetical protein
MSVSVLISAVVKTAREVGQLGKAERNNFAKYNYVPIDKYYEVVGKLAASNGLVWQPRELLHEVLSNVGKDGAVKVTYAFDLYHESGEHIVDYSKITILHPIQGAQTAGSALSYADKCFMRSCFKIVTGEDDADASNPEDLKVRAKQEPAVKEVLKAFPDATITEVREKPEQGVAADPSPLAAVMRGLNKFNHPLIKTDTSDWASVLEVLRRAVVTATNLEEVMALWKDNIGVIDKMEKASSELHEELRLSFSAARKKHTKKDK